MEYLVKNIDLSQQDVIKLINEYVSEDIPLFGTGTINQIANARKKIHELMVFNDIIPRELSISYKIQNFIQQKFPLKIPDEFEIPDDVIFGIFYPDEEEKRMELYTFVSESLLDYVENEKKPRFDELKCEECEKSDYCIYKRPDFIYLRAGIKIDLEEIKEDFISNTLKEYTESYFLQYYGLFLDISIDKLIQSNLKLIQEFVEKEIFKVSEFAIETIKKIDNMTEKKIAKTVKTLNEYGVILA